MTAQELIARAMGAQQSGRLTEASTLYRQVLDALPPSTPPSHRAEILNNLGAILERQDRVAESIDCFRDAVAVAPAEAIPVHNLGDALHRAGRLEEATGPLRAAATLAPDVQPIWATLGAHLVARGLAAAALPALRRAVELDAGDANSHRCLGDALQSLGRLDEASGAYDHALRLEPADVSALYGSGRVHLDRKHPVEALAALERCVERAPTLPAALHDLGRARFELGQADGALDMLRRAVAATEGEMRAQALLTLACVVPGGPREDHRSILEARRAWARTLPSRGRPERRVRAEGAPLRLGYVSSFFHRANWMKPVWALINLHDRDRVNVHLFSDSPEGLSTTGYREDPRDRVHDISGGTNEEIANRIAELGIDVLVDLNAYSAAPRLALFALRPAPLQVAWFNMYATSGMDCFDVVVGDAHVVHPEEEDLYCEDVVRVPGSYLTFAVEYPVPDVTPPPILSTGHVTLGSLVSLYKITDDVVRTWAGVLKRCPTTRLLLRNATLDRESTRRHIADRFAAHGIVRERISFEGQGDHFEFLRTYDRVDIALDVFPYSGGTTTMEALWQGVPVVSCESDRWAGRTSLSLLRAAGLDEYVALDSNDYADLCVRLIESPEIAARLREFRETARERLSASAACDAAAFAGSMEALYDRLWQAPVAESPRRCG